MLSCRPSASASALAASSARSSASCSADSACTTWEREGLPLSACVAQTLNLYSGESHTSKAACYWLACSAVQSKHTDSEHSCFRQAAAAHLSVVLYGLLVQALPALSHWRLLRSSGRGRRLHNICFCPGPFPLGLVRCLLRLPFLHFGLAWCSCCGRSSGMLSGTHALAFGLTSCLVRFLTAFDSTSISHTQPSFSFPGKPRRCPHSTALKRSLYSGLQRNSYRATPR